MRSELVELAPAHWARRPIQDVCVRVTSGGTPSRSNPEFYEDGEWAWVKTQELLDSWIDDTEEHITEIAIDKSSAKILPEQTILLALYGATVGQLGILRRPMTCNQACCAIIVNPDEADYRYLFYLLIASRRQLKSLATGAAQQNLSGTLIKNFVLPFPKLEVQQRIADILGKLDDKIELNRRMNRTLEKMAAAIFKSWFIDFDAVRAKAEGRDPNLPAEIADLFPDTFEDSDLGPIPKGWEVGTISDLADVTSGKRPQQRSKERTAESHIPLYGGGGVMAYVAAPMIAEPLLLTGRVGTLGKIFRIVEPCWPSDNTLMILPNKQEYLEFLFFMLQRFDFSSLNRGSTQPLLTQTDIKKQMLVIPPLDVLIAFWQSARSIFAKFDSNMSEATVLAGLRDTLLSKLLSGEIELLETAEFSRELA